MNLTKLTPYIVGISLEGVYHVRWLGKLDGLWRGILADVDYYEPKVWCSYLDKKYVTFRVRG